LTRLPILSFAEAERALLKLGFGRTRQKGSHVFYRHPDGRTTTLPYHKGRDLSRPLMMKVLRDIELSADEFLSVLNKP
jgi:predicted RNA binding protein YcfA (HicA-like mRNA interferase family)